MVGWWMVGLGKRGRIGFGIIRDNVRVDIGVNIRVKGRVNSGRVRLEQVRSGQSREIAVDIDGISEMLHGKHWGYA